MEASRKRDAEDGHEIAKELEGMVTRKVVKQTVMTIVYGVTFVGGRLQIERQLKDLEMNDKFVFKASTYLVSKVFASIGEMFTAARAIQVSFSRIDCVIQGWRGGATSFAGSLLFPPPGAREEERRGREEERPWERARGWRRGCDLCFLCKNGNGTDHAEPNAALRGRINVFRLKAAYYLQQTGLRC